MSRYTHFATPCTSSPQRVRRGLRRCICSGFRLRPRHSLPSIIQCRRVSLLTVSPCLLLKYSAARVGPNPAYTSSDKIRIASCLVASGNRRGDGCPRNPCITALSPCFFSAFTNRFTCRKLTPNSPAACACVITPFFAFRNVTSRLSRLGSSVAVLPAPTQPELLKRTFLLCSMVTFSLCCDIIRIGSPSPKM